ncbi:hypothetical protein LINPERHAP2_LOCUS34535, partial [Linum perenne]
MCNFVSFVGFRLSVKMARNSLFCKRVSTTFQAKFECKNKENSLYFYIQILWARNSLFCKK